MYKLSPLYCNISCKILLTLFSFAASFFNLSCLLFPNLVFSLVSIYIFFNPKPSTYITFSILLQPILFFTISINTLISLYVVYKLVHPFFSPLSYSPPLLFPSVILFYPITSSFILHFLTSMIYHSHQPPLPFHSIRFNLFLTDPPRH